MTAEIVTVIVDNLTTIAYKRSAKRFILSHIAPVMPQRSLPGSLLLQPLLERFSSSVQGCPYIAQLCYRTKRASFQFVEVVAEHIAAFCEFVDLGLNCQLYLGCYVVVEFYVDEDIICALSKSVFNSDYFYLLGDVKTQLFELIVHS